jgi:hypothetical protein
MDDFEDVIFYYLRNSELNKNDTTAKRGVPIGVVAVRENEDGTVNRGVSICSPCDRYNKKAGRGIAFKRLLEAEAKKMSIPFGDYNGDDSKKNIINFPFENKADYRAKITAAEFRMFHKPED